jgi:hypothetical protein
MLATPLPDPSMDTRPPMNPTFVGPSLPVFASSDGKPRPPAMDAAASGSDAQAPAQRRVRAIRVVRMNADAGELGDLLRDLNITREQEAEFRVLPGSLEQPPPLDARSVLWWASGPESWTRKIVVPIVVETVE